MKDINDVTSARASSGATPKRPRPTSVDIRIFCVPGARSVRARAGNRRMRRSAVRIAGVAAGVAKLHRRVPGVLLEEATKISRIVEAETVGNLRDRAHGIREFALGFHQHP